MEQDLHSEIPLLNFDKESVPDYVSKTFTDERRRQLIDSCPPELLRKDGKPALLYRHMNLDMLTKLLSVRTKSGWEANDHKPLDEDTVTSQFRSRLKDPELQAKLMIWISKNFNSVLSAANDNNFELIRTLCGEMSAELRAHMAVRGLISSTYFGFIPSSLIPMNLELPTYVELVIPPQKWTLHDGKNLGEEFVKDREMQVLLEEISQENISMVYLAGEMGIEKKKYIVDQFGLEPDISVSALQSVLDDLRSTNKKDFLPQYFK